MELRQWMVPYEWMVKYTPQTEWIERRGVLVWIAEVFGSIGPGLYIVALFYNSQLGMFIAWLIIIFLKILPHMVYFGKPLRFWRTLPPFSNAWKTSWIARGVIFTGAFIGFAFMQFILSHFLPGTVWEIAFRVIAGTSAFLTGIYNGFVFSYCRSVPFWNSAILPLLFLFTGIADGFAMIMAIGLCDVQIGMATAEAGNRILLTINAIIMAAYVWNGTYTSKTAKYSAMLLLRGNLALPFWGGVITLGIIIPLAISVSSYFAGEVSVPLLIAATTVHTIGTAALKYCLLKAGIHSPVIPVTTSNYH